MLYLNTRYCDVLPERAFGERILIVNDRRNYVQKLVFYPAQLSDEAHRDDCRKFLKDRIDRHSHTHNDSELRLIRYLGNYAHALEAQKLLFANDTVVKLLARIFRHLPNMQGFDIFTGRSYVGGAKLTKSFEGFNPAEFDYSGKNTLRSLFIAFLEAPVRISRLGFITNRALCPNDYNGDDCNLIYSSLAKINRRRRDFVLSQGDVWTDSSIVSTLPSALRSGLACSSLSSLRDFRLYLDSNYRVLTGGESDFGDGLDSDLYPALNKVFKYARNLERLEFGLNCDCYHCEFYDCGLDSGFDVGAAFKNEYLTRLKHIELRHCEPKKVQDVLKLFQMCADLLEVVYIEDKFTDYDSWRDILRLLKKYQFPNLKRFDLHDYKYGGFYSAGPYLQGLEADNPIPEQLKGRWA